MSTPYAVRRHRTWYLRLRVPRDLSPALGQHVVRSLGTSCPREARAAAALHAGAAPNWWTVLRTQAMARVLGKSIEEIRIEDLTRANLDRLARDVASLDDAEKRRLRDHLDEILDRADEDRRHMTKDVELVRLQVKMFSRGREAALMEVARSGNGAHHHEAPRAREAPARAAHDPRLGLALTDLAEPYFADRGMGESARISNMKAFRDFEALVGKKGIGAITPADLDSYKRWLLAQPGRAGRDGAATGTVVKKLNHVRAVLTWAAEDAGILAETPGARVKPPREPRHSRAEPKRLPFDEPALVRIFFSPLYTGCEGPRFLAKPGPCEAPADRRFFFLCMLLTGARTEELPGAVLTDIGGVTCLDVRDTATKTQAARRLMPILPELRRTGFVAWAKARIAAGGKLFRGEDCPADWSQWTGRYLKALGVSDRFHVPYSLRHNFRLMLRAGNLNTETANRVFGHEEGVVSEEYGKVPLAAAEAKAVLRCVRAPIDLGHLFVIR